METYPNNEYEILLRSIANDLDISDTHYTEADNRYKSLGEWLNRENSTVSDYNPEVFPQGSFSLGTVIKPVSDENDYDIDLVCEIKRTKNGISQKTLKNQIGEEVYKYYEAQNMKNEPVEKRRCWRLDYASGANFHMDILPAIPESDIVKAQIVIDDGAPLHATQVAIAITDNTEVTYDLLTNQWPSSNPKGYAAWFIDQMQVQYDLELERIKNRLEIQASVESIPGYRIKTPLQRAIQVLKRHRDIMFEGDDEYKPTSIIISTLAAKSYNNESSIYEALGGIVKKMESFIEIDDYANPDEDHYLILNPVNNKENFADKWKEDDRWHSNFMKWLEQVHVDFMILGGNRDIVFFSQKLKLSLGESLVKKSLNKIYPGNAMVHFSESGTSTGLKLSASHKEEPTWDMQILGTVHVIGTYTRPGFRRQPSFSNGIKNLPKRCDLRFEASVSPSIRKPYSVYWQIVNTGDEAERARNLRGGFYNSTIRKGKRVRTEKTKFTGLHWVQCFITKTIDEHEVCVARSREFQIKIGED